MWYFGDREFSLGTYEKWTRGPRLECGATNLGGPPTSNTSNLHTQPRVANHIEGSGN